jgi:hypothetical protein
MAFVMYEVFYRNERKDCGSNSHDLVKKKTKVKGKNGFDSLESVVNDINSVDIVFQSDEQRIFYGFNKFLKRNYFEMLEKIHLSSKTIYSKSTFDKIIGKDLEFEDYQRLGALKDDFVYPFQEAEIVNLKDWALHFPRLKDVVLNDFIVSDVNPVLEKLETFQLNGCFILQSENHIAGGKKLWKFVLFCCYFEIKYTTIDLRNCVELLELSITNCPFYFFPEFSTRDLRESIRFLNFSGTNLFHIERFPSSLLNINVSRNYLTKLPALPPELNTLTVHDNPLYEFPSNMIHCARLEYVSYENTQVELNVMQIRFLNRLAGGEKKSGSIFDDKQNIHNSFIQKSFLESCQSLFKDKIPDYEFPRQFLQIDEGDKSKSPRRNKLASTIDWRDFWQKSDNDFGPKKTIEEQGTKNLSVENGLGKRRQLLCVLSNFLSDNTMHCILNVSYAEVFQKVWNRLNFVKDKEVQLQLCQRLFEEIGESEGMCFTGRITRLVNSLVGFYDDIHIQIDESDQIRNYFEMNLQRNMGVMNEEEIIRDLRNIDVDAQKISEWLEFYREYTG